MCNCKAAGYHSSGGEATREEGPATKPETVTYALTRSFATRATESVRFLRLPLPLMCRSRVWDCNRLRLAALSLALVQIYGSGFSRKVACYQEHEVDDVTALLASTRMVMGSDSVAGPFSCHLSS